MTVKEYFETIGPVLYRDDNDIKWMWIEAHDQGLNIMDGNCDATEFNCQDVSGRQIDEFKIFGEFTDSPKISKDD